MDVNTTIDCILHFDNEIDLKTIVLAISLLFSISLSIFFYIKNRNYAIENSISNKLFKIQDLTFNNSFLEHKIFIDGWDDFAKKYRSNTDINYNDEELTRYLQYEQYCEMIFNLISDTYKYAKKEHKLLEFVDFKEWARTHKSWWENPLEEHSNYDTYDKTLTDMIDRWIK